MGGRKRKSRTQRKKTNEAGRNSTYSCVGARILMSDCFGDAAATVDMALAGNARPCKSHIATECRHRTAPPSSHTGTTQRGREIEHRGCSLENAGRDRWEVRDGNHALQRAERRRQIAQELLHHPSPPQVQERGHKWRLTLEPHPDTPDRAPNPGERPDPHSPSPIRSVNRHGSPSRW